MKTSKRRRIHLGAAHTVALVQSHLKADATVLDAGSGDGIVAEQLSEEGYTVTAIDSNEDAVAEAIDNGVETEHVSFLDFHSKSLFDLVLLSRSFHHMQPLELAVTQARTLLKKNGLIVLEEFAAETMDEASAVWFYGLKTLLKAGGTELLAHGPKIEHGKIPADPLESWNKHHFGKHGVAESGEMMAALEAGFKIIELQRAPYLYRYFLDDVSAKEAEAIYQWESRQCEAGTIVPIGLRIVGRKT